MLIARNHVGDLQKHVREKRRIVPERMRKASESVILRPIRLRKKLLADQLASNNSFVRRTQVVIDLLESANSIKLRDFSGKRLVVLKIKAQTTAEAFFPERKDDLARLCRSKSPAGSPHFQPPQWSPDSRR